MQNFLDEGQLARKHGRLEEVWAYRYYSTMLHHSDLGQSHRSIRPERATLIVQLRNTDPGLGAAVLVSAMTPALHSFKAMAAMLGWTKHSAPEIDRLLERVESLFPDDPETF